jgi:CubicO group peptidase (beta-lactamase class C family)
MKRSILFITLAALLLPSCKQEKEIIDLPRTDATPEVVAAVDAFVEATRTRPVPPDSITLHSIMILKHGDVVFEKWFNGQTAQTPHAMYSVSKTFTATAVGLAINEGKLKLNDPVIKFFPDKLPAEPSDNLKAMTVRDLLTMTCGHDTEFKTAPVTAAAKAGIEKVPDWAEGFLSWPVLHKPGEYYLYNSLGTYMLSAIVQKVTGEKLIDYLDTRLFQPLHIARPEWQESPQGINCGGWGLFLKTEDMAKMGQLFLQKGKWNGKQIVPADWLNEMSSYQVPSAPSGTRFEDLEKAGLNKDNNEWVQGYGYQMWVCRHNAYRADGFAGQYIMVFPDRDAVLVLTTSSSLYQPYIDLIWEYLLPIL